MLKNSTFDWSNIIHADSMDFGIQKYIHEECERISRQWRMEEDRELKKFMAETGLQPKEIVMKVLVPYDSYLNGHVYGKAYWFEQAPAYVPDYII